MGGRSIDVIFLYAFTDCVLAGIVLVAHVFLQMRIERSTGFTLHALYLSPMTIKTSASTTSYQDMGEGPILIMLHGWGCDWQIFAPVIRGLSSTFRLIIPDLPAFGQSRIADDAIWDSFDYVVWLEEFISAVVTERDSFSLLGHSFGGKIAGLYAAQMQPQQLERLILVDASGLPVRLSTTQSLQSRVIQLIPKVMKDAVPLTLKAKVLGNIQLSTDYLHSTKLQKMIFKKIVHEDISEYLPKITVPTRVMWGKNDLDTPLEKGKEFARLIPDAQLHIFDQSGHFPFIDETAKFVDTVLVDSC